MMASWYKTGTITVTNGSTTVTGSGTQWIANAAVGEALYAPDGRLYEITNIASDTSFTIAPAYLGTTASGQSYVIVPSQSYIRDLASQAADLVNQYSTIANFAGQGKFGDGTVTAPGIRFSDDLDTGLYRIGSNNLGISAGGTKIVDVSSSGITVTGTINGTTLPTSATLVTTTGTQTLTNKTLTAPVIGTISNTGTLTLPTSTDTLVGRNTTDTLTNKTLTSPTITGTGTAAFGNLSYTGTLTGSTGILNIGSGQIYKDASGNVGIGGTAVTGWANKQVVLDAGSDASAAYVLVNDTTGRAGTDGSIITLSGSDMFLINRESANMIFRTANTERMRIDSAGNVGIGTSAPSQLLTVSGSGAAKAIRIATTSSHAAFVETSADNTVSARLQSNLVDAFLGTTSNHPLFFNTNNAERMRITSAGNVGIGTSSPIARLDVTGNSFATANVNFAQRTDDTVVSTAVTWGSSSGNWMVRNNTGALTFNSGNTIGSSVGTERMRIDSSGNVGIGTSSPAHKLHVAGNAFVPLGSSYYCFTADYGMGTPDSAGLQIYSATSDGSGIRFGGRASGTFTERMRIDGSGYLLVGQTSAGVPSSSARIYSGQLFLDPNQTASNAANTFFEASTGKIWRSTSSIRYKTNVQDYAKGLAEVLKLRPVTYNSINGNTDKLFAGFTAEDVDADGLIEFVEYDSEKRPDSIAYSNMVALLTKAIQEQQAQIEQLRAEIEILKGA
jgi:hypothetical protein